MKKKIKKNKKMGIIGGMGPDASVRFLQRVVELSRENHGVKLNHEYPEIILASIPVEDFVNKTKTASDAINRIMEASMMFEEIGVECFGISCNTAHIILANRNISLPYSFVSMINETVKEVARRKLSKVGLLGSPVTINSGTFQDKFAEVGINTIAPQKRDVSSLGSLIVDILGGNTCGAGEKLEKIAQELKDAGAEAVILACTELPLVFPQSSKISTIDTSDVLVKALLTKYYKNIGEKI